MKRRAIALAAVALVGAVLWQLRPLILWRLTVRPALARQGDIDRFRIATETRFPVPPADWTHVAVGPLSFRAPLGAEVGAHPETCASCTDGCVLGLDRGRLTVFTGTAPSDFETARDRLAADPGDLRWFRSRERNWHTLRALADRAQLASPPPETFRFVAAGGKGVVTRFFSEQVERFVLYAWSPRGRPAPVLALSQVDRAVLLGVVGTLRVEDGYAGSGPARCGAG